MIIVLGTKSGQGEEMTGYTKQKVSQSCYPMKNDHPKLYEYINKISILEVLNTFVEERIRDPPGS